MSDPPEKINENQGQRVAEMAGPVVPPEIFAGLSDAEKKELKEINENILKEMKDSIDLLRDLKGNIKAVSVEIKKDFRDTRIMYWSLFILGIFLVLAAVPVALLTQKELFSLLFGSAGVIDILAFFLKDPPLQLQKSRANLTKLQAAYYQWLVDATNWSTVLYSQSQAGHLGIKDMKEASDSYVASFSAVMRAIDGSAQDTATAATGDKSTKA